MNKTVYVVLDGYRQECPRCGDVFINDYAYGVYDDLRLAKLAKASINSEYNVLPYEIDMSRLSHPGLVVLIFSTQGSRCPECGRTGGASTFRGCFANESDAAAAGWDDELPTVMEIEGAKV